MDNFSLQIHYCAAEPQFNSFSSFWKFEKLAFSVFLANRFVRFILAKAWYPYKKISRSFGPFLGSTELIRVLLLKAIYKIVIICGTLTDGVKRYLPFILENIQQWGCQNMAKTWRLVNGWEMSKNQLFAIYFSAITWVHKIKSSDFWFSTNSDFGEGCNPIHNHALTFWVGIVKLFHSCVLWLPTFGLSGGRIQNHVDLQLGLT